MLVLVMLVWRKIKMDINASLMKIKRYITNDNLKAKGSLADTKKMGVVDYGYFSFGKPMNMGRIVASINILRAELTDANAGEVCLLVKELKSFKLLLKKRLSGRTKLPTYSK